jgi:hypothetical protein
MSGIVLIECQKGIGIRNIAIVIAATRVVLCAQALNWEGLVSIQGPVEVCDRVVPVVRVDRRGEPESWPKGQEGNR